MTLQAFMQRFPGWTAAEHWARAETLRVLYAQYEARLAEWVRIQNETSPPIFDRAYKHYALTCNALGWAQERHMQAALALSTGDQK